jgi:8-oxo-dGTP diphosphatase
MSSIGVFASLFDTSGRILLVRQAYAAHRWTTPGGRVEDGESPLMALEREVLEEIGCEVQVAHLIGVYAKPYRDDLVLSFAATLVGGTPRACSPEIADIGFFQGGDIPADIAFNSMVRVRDALDGCRGVVRVFDSATSLVPK